jgi:hypothetical protein
MIQIKLKFCLIFSRDFSIGSNRAKKMASLITNFQENIVI